MAEIKPFLLKEVEHSVDVFEKNKGFMYEEKINGVRALVSVKNGKITAVRGRNNNPILHLFPELEDLKLNLDNTILDSEIAMVDENNKSFFYSGIDQRRSRKTMEQIAKMPYKLKIFVFDALKINDKVVISKPYKERYGLLKDFIEDSRGIELVKVWDNPDDLWGFVEQNNREGIIARNPMSVYELDTRVDVSQAFKLKNYKEAIVTVLKTEENEKGIKISGKAIIKGKEIDVECQISNMYKVALSSEISKD